MTTLWLVDHALLSLSELEDFLYRRPALHFLCDATVTDFRATVLLLKLLGLEYEQVLRGEVEWLVSSVSIFIHESSGAGIGISSLASLYLIGHVLLSSLSCLISGLDAIRMSVLILMIRREVQFLGCMEVISTSILSARVGLVTLLRLITIVYPANDDLRAQRWLVSIDDDSLCFLNHHFLWTKLLIPL